MLGPHSQSGLGEKAQSWLGIQGLSDWIDYISSQREHLQGQKSYLSFLCLPGTQGTTHIVDNVFGSYFYDYMYWYWKTSNNFNLNIYKIPCGIRRTLKCADNS